MATNLAVLVVLSISLHLLGIGSLLDEQGVGLNLNARLIFAAVISFGGSLISSPLVTMAYRGIPERRI